MTNITFHGGVNDIGGNKFLVESKDTKVFMDFGMSFSQEGQRPVVDVSFEEKSQVEKNSPLSSKGRAKALETIEIPSVV